MSMINLNAELNKNNKEVKEALSKFLVKEGFQINDLDNSFIFFLDEEEELFIEVRFIPYNNLLITFEDIEYTVGLQGNLHSMIIKLNSLLTKICKAFYFPGDIKHD